MAKGKNVLTTGDVAKICNVAPRTVSKWFDNGQLRGYRIPGSKDRRIPLAELIRFMKMHNMPTDALPVGTIRVLLVDAETSRGKALAESLGSKTDYEVRLAATEFQAGATVQRFTPHVVVINLVAEEIDAAAICRSIRADEEFQTIKIIAIAQGLGRSECDALLRSGYDATVSSCEDPTRLIKAIEQVTAIIY